METNHLTDFPSATTPSNSAAAHIRKELDMYEILEAGAPIA
jgi:hypothetical protein